MFSPPLQSKVPQYCSPILCSLKWYTTSSPRLSETLGRGLFSHTDFIPDNHHHRNLQPTEGKQTTHEKAQLYGTILQRTSCSGNNYCQVPRLWAESRLRVRVHWIQWGLGITTSLDPALCLRSDSRDYHTARVDSEMAAMGHHSLFSLQEITWQWGWSNEPSIHFL